MTILFTESSNEISDYTSPNIYYSEDSICYFRRKYIVYVITYLSNTRVNQLIIMDYLKKIDELELCDRSVTKPYIYIA